MSVFFDVVIMGGGPAGATLGAILAQESLLSVAIYEKDTFPRDHIGESFAHPLIPVLEQSGALAKVLASDCWVKKYGGVFNWDDAGPSLAYFDHANWLRDGVHRWSMHVNRSQFDHILLDHARSCGVEVFQGIKVVEVDCQAGAQPRLILAGGDEVRARVLVDASGRHNKTLAGGNRAWLSSYRNVATWQHFTGGRFTQNLEGDWNIFQDGNFSPIGCFAFDDGWCWYIPVPKDIDGKRRLTHSIGIVTNPDVLSRPGKDFTDPEVFLRTVKSVPMLADLVQDVRPVSDGMLTATNYSRISDSFCNAEEGWMLIGDSAYFVDPLFSSGVAFAAAQASAAALVIRLTLEDRIPVTERDDLWRDYDKGWQGMAETYALSIDQWYHAIGERRPESAYWNSHGSFNPQFREDTFQALLNTAFTPDLLQVMTRGSGRLAELNREGPYMRARAEAEPAALGEDAVVVLTPAATARPGIGLDVPGFKSFVPPPPFTIPAAAMDLIARYWRNPVVAGPSTPAPLDQALPCLRFVGAHGSVRSLPDRDAGDVLWARLKNGPIAYRDLCSGLDTPSILLLDQMRFAGVVEVQGPATTATHETMDAGARR
ncbi:MAG: NAD(P)/FAD-dependent oxidoreductase [Frankia sp.]